MANAASATRTALPPANHSNGYRPKSHERPSLAVKRPRLPGRVAILLALRAYEVRLSSGERPACF
jgi:hypothetical protein